MLHVDATDAGPCAGESLRESSGESGETQQVCCATIEKDAAGLTLELEDGCTHRNPYT